MKKEREREKQGDNKRQTNVYCHFIFHVNFIILFHISTYHEIRYCAVVLRLPFVSLKVLNDYTVYQYISLVLIDFKQHTV